MAVLGVIGGASILVLLEGVLHLLGELGELLLHGGDEQRHRCRTGGNDEVLETLGFSHRELCGEHASPRIPQEIEIVVDFEVFEEIVEFGDEERDGPESDIALLFGEMGRHSTADLVVEDDGDFIFGPEVGEGEHVIVDDAWTAMEDDQGTVFLIGEISVDLVPSLGGLTGARDDEVNLASNKALSGHGTQMGRLEGRFVEQSRGISLFYPSSGLFSFLAATRLLDNASVIRFRARWFVEGGIPLESDIHKDFMISSPRFGSWIYVWALVRRDFAVGRRREGVGCDELGLWATDARMEHI